MNKGKNSKDNGFELDDFWGFSDSNLQNKKNAGEEDAWSFDDLFAAKEQKETAKLEEERLIQERALARAATKRQIEAEFAAKKMAEEKAKEEARLKEEAEAAAATEAQRLEAEAESEKERVRRQAEEKAKMQQTRRKPLRVESSEEAPNPEEFSDTATTSLNRLKPEIRLTSVEPLIGEEKGIDTTEYENAEFEYEDEYEYEDGEYDEEYEYEDGEYDEEYEYEDGEYDQEYEYEDGEYDGEYEYEDGEYDEEYEYEDGEYDEEYEYEDGEYDEEYEYDYEAEEEEQQKPAGDIAALKQNGGQGVQRQKTEYGTEEDWKVLAGDDEEDERSKKPLIIGIICGVVVLVLIAIIFWAFGREDEKKPVSDESSIALVQEEKQLTGVITGIDQTNGSLLIYNAESGKEETLAFQTSENDMTKWNIGQVVDVVYQTGTSKQLKSISSSYTATTLSDISNAVPNGSIVELNGTTYYIDSKLICLYQGQAFDVNQITPNTRYDALVLNNHIYTITISYATGTLKLENMGQYADATMALSPTNGDKIEVVISTDLQPIELVEGSVDIQIYKDNEILYTGKTFISAGKENTLKLPSTQDKKGKVLFGNNMDAEMSIMINGKEYTGEEEIELAYGDYTGVFTATGYDAVEMEFSISQPYQQINVEFEEKTTLVTISSSIWGASLYVDGVYQGELEGNSISVRLAPGGHSITCTRTGYYDQHQSIMILEGMDDQMLYFSGFQAVETEESSTPNVESSTTTEESSTPTTESSTTIEESSTPAESSDTAGGESAPEESTQDSAGSESTGA